MDGLDDGGDVYEVLDWLQPGTGQRRQVRELEKE
jgi:hypothetical protein